MLHWQLSAQSRSTGALEEVVAVLAASFSSFVGGVGWYEQVSYSISFLLLSYDILYLNSFSILSVFFDAASNCGSNNSLLKQ